MKTNKLLLTTAVIASLGTTAFAADTTVGTGNGIAYGTATEAIGVKSIAIGNTVKASDDNSIAIGYDASAKGINAIAIGSSQITNSSENPDTKTLVDGENSLAIGQAAQVTSNDSIAIGKDSKVYDSSNISTVVGYGAKSSAYMGSAFGANAHAGGSSSFAMGSFSEALGDNSVAIGQQAKAEKTDSYALGSGAEATNYYSSALGSNSHATGNGATAIGTASTANGDNSVAIGSYAVTKGENNVTLGYHSVDDDVVATSHSLINGHDYKFAGDDPYGTVSVGGVVDYDIAKDADGNPILNEDGTGYLIVKKHLTRTITNVAAGRVSATSTDAINGSQLYATVEAINKNHKDIVDTAKGLQMLGDVVSDHETAIAANKQAAADAMAEAKKHSTVIAGDNIVVTKQTNSNGGTEYKVSLKDEVGFGSNGDAVHNVVNKNGMIAFNGDVDTRFDANGMYIENRDNLDNSAHDINGVTADSNNRHVAFTTNGIDVGNQVINNVAAGTKDTDAVNVSQLKEVKQLTVDNKKTIENHEGRIIANENHITDLENKITDVASNTIKEANHYTDSQVASVGAQSAALAGLHPLDFNKDDKASYAASVGHYRNANAIAVGAFYRPNERTMVSGAVSFGKHLQMNLGVAFKTGKGSEYINEAKSKDSRIEKLEALVEQLTTEVAELKANK